jgi:ribonuclease VapC
VIAIDSSALVAILWAEPDAQGFADCISRWKGKACLSAVSFQETSAWIAGRTGDARNWFVLDEVIADAMIEIVPHDRDLALIARDAFLRFGKGRHSASLNFGDCAAYALAKSRDVPLLSKGQDFARTDIIPALPP